MDIDVTLTPSLIAAALVELALLLAGCWLLWRHALRPAARARHPVGLAAWRLPAFPFMGIAATVMVGGLLGQLALTGLAARIAPALYAGHDFNLLVAGAGFQLGMLVAAVGGALFARRLVVPELVEPAPPPAPRRSVGSNVLAGAVTFLCALPVVTAVSLAWNAVLRVFGIEPEPQDLVDLLLHPESSVTVGVMFVLATVVAPVTEELIFRAGLFRFLRTRLPRFWALALPAVLFGILHGSVAAFMPLVALGAIFALAYERTGSILVPITAHSIFNLNTILLVVAGVSA